MQTLVFGETNLLISCVDHLLEKKWQILGIVSEDTNIISWSKSKGITVFSIRNVSNHKFENYYLFSIINPHIISKKFLEDNPPILALNYHDSLLPKYAGVNSTSWAILNNEEFHGISWHKITSSIDDGDIIYKKKIEITPHDTAFDLDIKCTQECLKGFIKIINKISRNEIIKTSKQNLKKRSYYGREFIPDNYGILNFKDSDVSINQILNALYLGSDYTNPITTAKILYKNNFYIVEKENYSKEFSSSNSDILVFKDIYGFAKIDSVSFSKEIENCKLDSKDLYALQQIKRNEFKTLHALTSRNLKYYPTHLENKFETVEVNLNNELCFSDLCPILLLLLSKFKITQSYIKIYQKNLESEKLKLLTDSVSFLDLDLISSSTTFDELISKVSNALDINKVTIAKDFEYRYKLNLNPEIAIIDDDNNCVKLKPYKIQIYFSNKKRLKIKFLKEYSETVNLLIRVLNNQVTNLLTHIHINIQNFSLITPHNYYQNVNDWVSSYNMQNQEKTLNSLINQHVRSSTDSLALLYNNNSITYSLLHEKSNKLARYLIKTYEIKIGDFVIVNLECSESFIIVILAILKTGGIFIPINPSRSIEKIKYILEDSYIKLIILDDKIQLQQTIVEFTNKDVAICEIKPTLTSKNLESFSSENLNVKISGDLPACLIYSNLDNGKSLCIMISHNIFINKIELMNSEMQIYHNDKLWMCEDDYFEATIWFMFWAISNGATIILSNKNITNNNLLNFYCESRATVLYLNSDHLDVLNNLINVSQNNKVNRIRTIYYNQESLSTNQYTDISKSFGDGVLNTLYTPTYNSINLSNIISLDNNYYSKFSLLPESFDKNILSSSIEDAYPASHLQVGMLLASELSDTGAYHNVIIEKINAKFNATKFVAIWDDIIHTQELLRAKFRLDNDGWICLVENFITKFYEVYCDYGLRKIINFERKQAFNFNKPGLFKLIINLRQNHFDFVFSYHHAIADGNSANMLMRQFIGAYSFDKNINLANNLSYGEFVKKELESIISVANNKFWSDYLAETDSAEKIKWNFNSTKSADGLEILSLNLIDVDKEKIYDVAKNNTIGLDNIFLYAYIKTLSQFLNQEIVTIGLMVDNKIQSDGNNFLLGLFSNVIPYQFDMKNVRNNINGILSTFAQKVKLYKYKDFPYSKIKEIIQKDVFQFAFNYVSFESSTVEYERSNIPFTLNISSQVKGFTINFIVHDDVIDKNYLEYFSQYYIFHLRNIVNNPDNNNLDLIPEDYQKIVYDWNNTAKEFPRQKTIPQLFEEQVEKTPDNIAVVYESIKLTYRELNNLSNILATLLIEKYGVKIEDLIVLYLDRSEYIIIAILAVLKSGGAYVPISTDYPADRTNYILNDTNTKLVLTNEIFYDQLVSLKYANLSDQDSNNTVYNIYIIDNLNTKSTDMFALMNPLVGLKNNNLAYVIYTSGTTGKPNGVMVQHYNMVSTIYGMYYELKNSSNNSFNILSSTNFAFDIFGLEYCLPLLTGYMIEISKNTIIDKPIQIDKYNYIQLTPAKIEIFLSQIDCSNLNNNETHLITLLIGGERLKLSDLNYLYDFQFKKSPNIKFEIINVYGPTETTIWSTIKFIKSNELITIGKTLPNEKSYILSTKMKPLPIGVTGELYIAGTGVARSYLNKKELTQERFINNPLLSRKYITNESSKLYKTGDLCRYLSDGNIEYIGRNDEQVKVRGYRIELSEIETALLSIPEIKQACLVETTCNETDNSKKQIFGYYVVNTYYANKSNFEIVQNWENIYDNEYEKYDSQSLEHNFNCWNSYVTGLKIPEDEMIHWRNDTIHRIKSLNPKNILEIGVGSGLLMYPLLEISHMYYGTDISNNVLKKHMLNASSISEKIKLYNLAAHEIDTVKIKDKINVVIINSVCQYFPHIKYFEDVITKAINILSSDGHIFLGDVRNYDLLKNLIKNKLDYIGEYYDSNKINEIFLKENELLISPRYFEELSKKYKNIDIKILHKSDKYVNELSLYRYDVILSIIRNDSSSKHNISLEQNGLYNLPYANKTKPHKIIEVISSKLPNYMIPDGLIEIESLPLTINGKLDKKSLPQPELITLNNYAAPRNEMEERLSFIFANILNIPSKKIGIFDNFFIIGGNSILAIKLANFVNQSFNSSIRVSDIFANKTIALITKLIEVTRGQFKYQEYKICNTNNKNLYQPFELNNVQQAYYLGRMGEFELGNTSSHIYMELKFDKLDHLKLENALNKLIERHLGLRTIFINNQQLHLANPNKYSIKFSALKSDKEFLDIREDLSHKIYVPEVFPLFDFIVSKYKKQYTLHVSIDSLLMDGNSMQILFNELSILYDNPEKILPILNVNFKDYMHQFAQIRQSRLFDEAKQYWSAKLAQYNFEMNLPKLCHASQIKAPKFKRVSRIIHKSVWNVIEQKCKSYDISISSAILNLYGKVLSYWSNQNKCCINLTLFNRLPLHSQINEVIGDFTVLELFNYESHNMSILESIRSTHNTLWNDIDNNLFDGVDFQRLARNELSISGNQVLAPVVLTVMLGNDMMKQKILINDSYLGINYAITQTSQTWLDNKAYETNDGFIAEWDYVEQLFDENTIIEMHNHYCYLIESLAELNWEISVLPFLKLPSRDLEIINHANSYNQEIPIETLFSYYEKFVTTHKLVNQIAIIDNSDINPTEYTYKQLMLDSELLARYLCVNHGTDNLLFAVLSDKGYNQVVSCLAIMKSGHAYLPLNVEWPLGRIEDVLIQGQVNVVLVSREQYANTELIKKLSPKFTLLIIEDILSNHSKNELQNISLPNIKPTDIAYVIFTSGSTGVPKGVTISHKGALNTILAVNKKYNVSKKDKVLALSELSFDLSVYDIFGILAVGGTIVFPRQNDTKDPRHWNNLINQHKITIWNTVPQLAELLLDNVAQLSQSDAKILGQRIRLFLLSGDWISPSLPNIIKTYFEKSMVISLGGATEGSIWSIWYDLDTLISGEKTPYGIAMPNQKMYILNNLGEHCPIGVNGEIYIGGNGVALNYWNDTDKTANSFIKHESLGMLYKTGDLGKWHKDGYIEFLGRIDNQVKINGYRVELQEIEKCINAFTSINKCIVELYTDPATRLVAYLIYNNSIRDASLIGQLISPSCCAQNRKNITFSTNISSNINRKFNTIELDELYFQAILKLFQELKLFAILSNKTSISEIIKQTGILPRYKKWLKRALNTLVEHKYLKENNQAYYTINTYCSDHEKIFEQLKDVEDVEVLVYVAKNLKEILIENSSAQFYTDYATKETYKNIFTQEYNLVGLILKNLFKNHVEPITILEVGAGTGSLAEVILENCSLDGDHYIFTDISNYFLNQIKENYPNNNNLITQIYNLDQDPQLQGIAKYSADIIIANDVLHNVKDIKKTLKYLYNLLKPGGALLFIEIVEFLKCYDLLMGVITGFESFEDYELRPDHPLLSIKQWDELCLQTGFISSQWSSRKRFSDKNHDIALGIYFKSETTQIFKLAPHKLEKLLIKKLPEYMVPKSYIELNDIPLSPQGKLDRKALPNPEIIKLETPNQFEAPKNKLEMELCGLFIEILNIQDLKVGINHDFFKLGGDSLLAIKLISKLNNKYKITLNDIFKFKTPAKIALNITPITIINFSDTINHIKRIQDRLSFKPLKINPVLEEKNNQYKNDLKSLIVDTKIKNIINVLLTGSTGYLGCHILYQLLFKTNYKIYLLIRAKSNEDAYCRLYNKFKYYFDLELKDFSHRIEIISSNIEHKKLGLSNEQYNNLTNNVDSVIHAAAKVKYYGDYEIFYKINVEATINILELTKLTKLKDFHYISTIGVHLDTYIPDCCYYSFNETDKVIGVKQYTYVQTKYEAELIVIKYRDLKINSNIYRLGNLAMNSHNYKIQENFEENAFFIKMNTILNLGMIPKEIAKVEISPVDYTASAIVKLFDKNVSNNYTYHLTNPYLCNLQKLFKQSPNVNVKMTTLENFVANVMSNLDNHEQINHFKLFMLHHKWIGETDVSKVMSVEIIQDRTIKILHILGFEWTPITENMFLDIINKSFS